MSHFRKIDDALSFRADKMAKNGLFATERFFLDIYAFEPGQSQKAHRHADSDKVYVVLEGRARFVVDGEDREVGPGHAVHCPAGSEHEVSNPGPGRTAILTYMAPPPG